MKMYQIFALLTPIAGCIAGVVLMSVVLWRHVILMIVESMQHGNAHISNTHWVHTMVQEI